MAGRLIRQLDGPGYLLGDKGYHAWYLLELAALAGQVFLTPRKDAAAGLGHGTRWKRPVRRALLACLEVWLPGGGQTLAQSLYEQRRAIERRFGNLVCFGAGLGTALPPWVRRITRVRRWVQAKLLINACRIRALRPQTGVAA